MFYYVDDNFIILSEEIIKGKDAGPIKTFAKLTNYSHLKTFQGVFLSSLELKNFFETQRLHENLYLLEPVLNISDKKDVRKKKNIVLAFMGSILRQELFVEVVMPALLRLNKDFSIQILCPKLQDNSLLKNFKIDLDIVEFEYTSSVDLLLQEYKKKKPDILIHCGPEKKNNLYKTENALLNAVQLDAVLVTSNVLPYSKNISNTNPCFVVSENTELNWYETLLELCQDVTMRNKICENAKEYCNKKYHPMVIKKEFDKALESVKTTSMGAILRRYEELYFDLCYRGNRFSTDNNVTTKAVRPLHNASLCLSKLVPSETAYRIRVTVSNWSELGICFSS